MSAKTDIKPREGLTILDPKTGRIIPPEGISVTMNEFWRRRLRDKDIELGKGVKSTKSTAKAGGKGEA